MPPPSASLVVSGGGADDTLQHRLDGLALDALVCAVGAVLVLHVRVDYVFEAPTLVARPCLELPRLPPLSRRRREGAGTGCSCSCSLSHDALLSHGMHGLLEQVVVLLRGVGRLDARAACACRERRSLHHHTHAPRSLPANHPIFPRLSCHSLPARRPRQPLHMAIHLILPASPSLPPSLSGMRWIEMQVHPSLPPSVWVWEVCSRLSREMAGARHIASLQAATYACKLASCLQACKQPHIHDRCVRQRLGLVEGGRSEQGACAQRSKQLQAATAPLAVEPPEFRL